MLGGDAAPDADARFDLIHTMLIKPRAILLVQARNVFNEPVVQEEEEILHVRGLAVLQPGDGLLELCQQTLVLGAVLSQTGESILFH